MKITHTIDHATLARRSTNQIHMDMVLRRELIEAGIPLTSEVGPTRTKYGKLTIEPHYGSQPRSTYIYEGPDPKIEDEEL